MPLSSPIPQTHNETLSTRVRQIDNVVNSRRRIQFTRFSTRSRKSMSDKAVTGRGCQLATRRVSRVKQPKRDCVRLAWTVDDDLSSSTSSSSSSRRPEFGRTRSNNARLIYRANSPLISLEPNLFAEREETRDFSVGLARTYAAGINNTHQNYVRERSERGGRRGGGSGATR